MVEIITMIVGAAVGFMITLGWYKRGFAEMEKEIGDLKIRLDSVESKTESTSTDVQVIKTRIEYMEKMIGDIHGVIMKPTLTNNVMNTGKLD